MRPGGHLATAVALGGVGWMVTGSAELAAGCVAGGFLIDTDHYLDYVVFEGEWRRPGPAAFLRYYFTHRYRRVVIPLHSLELMAALILLALAWPRPALLGYLAGASLHIVLDILVNNERLSMKQSFLFYWFAYRAALGFSAARLMVPVVGVEEADRGLVWDFFIRRPLGSRRESG